MSDLFIEPDDATPLSAEEREGLIPTHIALRRELNELEQENILDADIWAFQRRRDPIDEAFGRSLHRRMFGKVWSWAGDYRLSDKNIGVPRATIAPRLYELFDNIGYWGKNGTFSPDEVAARFHHGLVFIHPFPNGNGRWSRLMGGHSARSLRPAAFHTRQQHPAQRGRGARRLHRGAPSRRSP